MGPFVWLDQARGQRSFGEPAGSGGEWLNMGWVRGTLPAGLQFLGDAWSEPRLIALAFAYEQATRHRRPPLATPPLPAR
ncbi:MAG: hypothetical protein ACREMQ_17425 [Longimicrobiales bacterium]